MKVAFVTNFCPHYRVKTFEMLAQRCNVEFFFYSVGSEWYWQRNHGVSVGAFPCTYLSGFQVSKRIRVTPSLPEKLWRGKYDVYIKCIDGRLALPMTYLVARLRRKPFILWTGLWMPLQTLFHRLVFPLTRWIYHHADAIVVYGEHVRRFLTQLNVPAEKIFVAPHAIDNTAYNWLVDEHEKAALRVELGLWNSRIILYLGRLEEIKGIAYLIQAFAHLSLDDTVLVIAGDGSLQNHLKALAREQGVAAKTRFVGYVSPAGSQVYYAIADLFVLPSVTLPTGKETWGLVVNEAMNQGLPVVATDAVGAAAGGLVQSGVTGIVVRERDTVALGQAIERILGDAEMRDAMGRRARQVVASWDNERMVYGFQRAIEFVMLQRS